MTDQQAINELSRVAGAIMAETGLPRMAAWSEACRRHPRLALRAGRDGDIPADPPEEDDEDSNTDPIPEESPESEIGDKKAQPEPGEDPENSDEEDPEAVKNEKTKLKGLLTNMTSEIAVHNQRRVNAPSLKDIQTQVEQIRRAHAPIRLFEHTITSPTEQQAFALALEENPEAYENYRNQHNARATVNALRAAGYEIRKI